VKIAFVLLTYAPDAPAGLERSTAALIAGLRELGHQVVVVTAAAGSAGGAGLITVPVSVPDPATEDDLLRALADPSPVAGQVRAILRDRDIDVVCWADTSWGLGYLAPAPPGVRTVLKIAVLRTDPLFRQALARHPDAVITNSDFLIGQAAAAGFDTAAWRAVPNALLTAATPPGPERREELRRTGPVRIAARAEPHKGLRELIEAIPDDLGRPADIALAAAGFEYWPGMQEEVIRECRDAARSAPGEVRILPALKWGQVPEFLAGAAATIISTTSPETWCNAAAEALSAGTPVIAYDFGHVPVLTGTAGIMVPPAEPAAALWDAATTLLADRAAYHLAARSAPGRVRGHTPAASARAFLAAVSGRRPQP
jgi:glycosyltransferase involved in cell wall biosynthesis